MTIRRVNNDITAAATTKKGIQSNRKGVGDFNKKNRPKREGFFTRGKSPVSKEQSTASIQQMSTEQKTPVRSESGDKMQAAGGSSDEKDKEKQVDIIHLVSKGLIEHPWYHGVMPREEITDLVKNDGDFLVRKTTEKGRHFICLSVRFGEDVKHIPLIYENGLWNLKHMETGQKFFELVELLNHLVTVKYQIPPSNAILIRAIPRPEYYILHDDVTCIEKLGSGAFGEVYIGKLKRRKGELMVAVKKMKAKCSKKKLIREFVREAKLMRRLQHQNIVQVIGVAPSEEPLMIVLELAKNGSLRSYMKKNVCHSEQKLQFCTDAARGMAYLSSQTIIHRDLAARNLLLGAELEVKIADFGLSEMGKTEVKINKMKLPIRWLAPETIDTGIFTTKTDVWSFSVTTWEIFSSCATEPYEGKSNPEVKDHVRLVNPPLQAPPDTPSVVVRLIVDCFERNPDDRPTFPMILKKLSPKDDVIQYTKPPRNVLEEGTNNELSANNMSCSRSRANHKPPLAPSVRPDVPKLLSVRPELPKPPESIPTTSTRALRITPPGGPTPSLVDTQPLNSAPRVLKAGAASRRMSSPDTRMSTVQAPASRISRRKR